MWRAAFFILFLVVFPLIGGCTKSSSGNGEAEQVELTVSAAASLTNALNEIKNSFEDDHKQIRLTFNFGSSSKLANQIDQGAPVDLYLSASSIDMDMLQEDGLIDESTREDLTTNELVLIGEKDTETGINSFEKIDPSAIDHLAIGEPGSVPVGRYTKETFERLGVWERLQTKLVMGSDVRQVLTYVEMGNADLGVVYSSDAFVSEKVKVLAQADPNWHEPIVYPGAVIEASEHKEEAQLFLEYLLKEEGQSILKKYGFN